MMTLLKGRTPAASIPIHTPSILGARLFFTIWNFLPHPGRSSKNILSGCVRTFLESGIVFWLPSVLLISSLVSNSFSSASVICFQQYIKIASSSVSSDNRRLVSPNFFDISRSTLIASSKSGLSFTPILSRRFLNLPYSGDSLYL